MGDARNGLVARDSHIWTMRFALVFSWLVIGGLVGVVYTKQNTISVQVPPDLSQGALLKPGEYLAPNSYSFAHYIWTELNTWNVNGKVDLPARLKTFDCYITSAFKQQLLKIQEDKRKTGELNRVRELTSMVAYRDDLVTDFGAKTFGVRLYLNLIEQVEGTVVKESPIAYPIRVVPDNRKCNRFGQALDGFYEKPYKFEVSDLEVI